MPSLSWRSAGTFAHVLSLTREPSTHSPLVGSSRVAFSYERGTLATSNPHPTPPLVSAQLTTLILQPSPQPGGCGVERNHTRGKRGPSEITPGGCGLRVGGHTGGEHKGGVAGMAPSRTCYRSLGNPQPTTLVPHQRGSPLSCGRGVEFIASTNLAWRDAIRSTRPTSNHHPNPPLALALSRHGPFAYVRSLTPWETRICAGIGFHKTTL